MKSKILFLITGLIFGVGGFGGWNRFAAESSPVKSVLELEPRTQEPTDRASVAMGEQKREAAEIELGQVVERTMTISRTVPGRLRYDDRRHIEVKVPTEGIVTEVRVKPGQSVLEGQVLAMVNSSEVGTARADVLMYAAQLQLAHKTYAWKKDTYEGVERLVAAVRAEQTPQSVADDMEKVSLGAYRASIIEAYSRYRLAQTLADNVAPLGDSGAVPGRTVKQRMSERESAQAAVATAVEQASYVAGKECAEARLAVEDSQRRLRISEQHLNTLLGYADNSIADRQVKELSLVEVRAAFDGTIEEQLISASERVEQDAAMFVLANTTQLWVAADIREKEWPALQLAEGQQVKLTTPALPGQEMIASVYYIGRQVDLGTNAVSLVASVDNTSNLLRPGQFMRVALPLGKPRQVTAVLETAIVEHESRPFVFVADANGLYRHTYVSLGMQADGWVEVVSGLRPGDRVVTQGAFYLKSELLLEGEEE